MLNPNYQSIEYAANTKLMDLAEELSTTRKPLKSRLLDQAAMISDYLAAVSYKTIYLEDDQVNNIYQCLIDVAEIQDYPVAPALPAISTPSLIVGLTGPQGPQGEKGDDGGATDFSATGVASDTVVDSFAVGLAYGARWDYLVNATAQRAGTIIGTWTEDGAALDWYEQSSPDVNGSTDGVSFTLTFVGGNIRLNAIVTSGSWAINGSRYFIPNNGAGVGPITNSLSNGKIYIGNASNIATEQSVTGDVTITSGGVTSIGTEVIVDADINASAAIAVTKLANLPNASSAVVTDGSSKLTTVSGVSATEVGYLANVTSDIQAQLDTKLSGASGAISTVVSSNLTANRAVISNGSGKIAVSGTTDTELGYVSGVTSALQTQINAKAPSASPTFTGTITTPLTASRAVATGGSSELVASSATSTELGYLSGVTSAIQTQLNGKVSDTSDTMTGTLEIQGGVRTQASGAYFKVKSVDIGDWNMDSTLSVAVAHGVGDFKKIRSVEVVIRNDADSTYYKLETPDISGTGVMDGGVDSIDATNINLSRRATGQFDNTSFNDTAYNRGFVTITYIA